MPTSLDALTWWQILLILIASAAGIAGVSGAAIRRTTAARDAAPIAPRKPGDYALTCPLCQRHTVAGGATLWMLHGILNRFRYGSRRIVGCMYCVRIGALEQLGENGVMGWWSITAFVLPFVLLQNAAAAWQAPHPEELDLTLRELGMKPEDLIIDADGLIREQRALLEATGHVIATAMWADDTAHNEEWLRGIEVLRKWSPVTLPDNKLRAFIEAGRGWRGNLRALEEELRHDLLRIAAAIAIADGMLAEVERTMLHALARRLALPAAAVDALLSRRDPSREHQTGSRESAESEHQSGAGEHGGPGSQQHARRRRAAARERACSVLGVAQDATQLEIRQAWRTAIIRFHPDRAGTDPSRQAEFTAKSQELNWAYEELKERAAA